MLGFFGRRLKVFCTFHCLLPWVAVCSTLLTFKSCSHWPTKIKSIMRPILENHYLKAISEAAHITRKCVNKFIFLLNLPQTPSPTHPVEYLFRKKQIFKPIFGSFMGFIWYKFIITNHCYWNIFHTDIKYDPMQMCEFMKGWYLGLKYWHFEIQRFWRRSDRYLRKFSFTFLWVWIEI